jgi:hypothetical protein
MYAHAGASETLALKEAERLQRQLDSERSKQQQQSKLLQQDQQQQQQQQQAQLCKQKLEEERRGHNQQRKKAEEEKVLLQQQVHALEGQLKREQLLQQTIKASAEAEQQRQHKMQVEAATKEHTVQPLPPHPQPPHIYDIASV